MSAHATHGMPHYAPTMLYNRKRCPGPKRGVQVYTPTLPFVTMTMSPSHRDLALVGKAGIEIIDLEHPKLSPCVISMHTKWDYTGAIWCRTTSCSSYLATTAGHNVHVWDLAHSIVKPAMTMHHNQNSIVHLDWNRQRFECILTCSTDPYIRLWDLRSKNTPLWLLSCWEDPQIAKFDRAHSVRIASAHGRKVMLWDARFGHGPREIIDDAHDAPITCIDWHRYDPNVFITSSLDGKIKRWDWSKVDEGFLTHEIDCGQPILGAEFTPFGRGIAVTYSGPGKPLDMFPEFGGPNPVFRWGSCTSPYSIVRAAWRISDPDPADPNDSGFELLACNSDRALRRWDVRGQIPALVGGSREDLLVSEEFLELRKISYTTSHAINRLFKRLEPSEPEHIVHRHPFSRENSYKIEQPEEITTRTTVITAQQTSKGAEFDPAAGDFESELVRKNIEEKRPIEAPAHLWRPRGATQRSGIPGPGHDSESVSAPYGDLYLASASSDASGDEDASRQRSKGLSMEDELVRIKRKYANSDNVRIDHMNFRARICTISVSGPWGSSSAQAFVRIHFMFPRGYPRRPLHFEVAGVSVLQHEVMEHINNVIQDIARRDAKETRYAVGHCIEYLLDGEGSRVLSNASQPRKLQRTLSSRDAAGPLRIKEAGVPGIQKSNLSTRTTLLNRGAGLDSDNERGNAYYEDDASSTYSELSGSEAATSEVNEGIDEREDEEEDEEEEEEEEEVAMLVEAEEGDDRLMLRDDDDDEAEGHYIQFHDSNPIQRLERDDNLEDELQELLYKTIPSSVHGLGSKHPLSLRPNRDRLRSQEHFVPFPRLCGGVFTGPGKLVCFFASLLDYKTYYTAEYSSFGEDVDIGDSTMPKDKGLHDVMRTRIGSTKKLRTLGELERYKPLVLPMALNTFTNRIYQNAIHSRNILELIEDDLGGLGRGQQLDHEAKRLAIGQPEDSSSENTEWAAGVRGNAGTSDLEDYDAPALFFQNHSGGQESANAAVSKKDSDLDTTNPYFDKDSADAMSQPGLGNLVLLLSVKEDRCTDPKLAKLFTLNGSDPFRICQENAKVAELSNRPDLETLWNVFACLYSPHVAHLTAEPPNRVGETSVLANSGSLASLRRDYCGLNAQQGRSRPVATATMTAMEAKIDPIANWLRAAFNWYKQLGDIQTLALIACALNDGFARTDRAEAPPDIRLSPTSVAARPGISLRQKMLTMNSRPAKSALPRKAHLSSHLAERRNLRDLEDAMLSHLQPPPISAAISDSPLDPIDLCTSPVVGPLSATVQRPPNKNSVMTPLRTMASSLPRGIDLKQFSSNKTTEPYSAQPEASLHTAHSESPCEVPNSSSSALLERELAPTAFYINMQRVAQNEASVSIPEFTAEQVKELAFQTQDRQEVSSLVVPERASCDGATEWPAMMAYGRPNTVESPQSNPSTEGVTRPATVKPSSSNRSREKAVGTLESRWALHNPPPRLTRYSTTLGIQGDASGQQQPGQALSTSDEANSRWNDYTRGTPSQRYSAQHSWDDSPGGHIIQSQRGEHDGLMMRHSPRDTSPSEGGGELFTVTRSLEQDANIPVHKSSVTLPESKGSTARKDDKHPTKTAVKEKARKECSWVLPKHVFRKTTSSTKPLTVTIKHAEPPESRVTEGGNYEMPSSASILQTIEPNKLYLEHVKLLYADTLFREQLDYKGVEVLNLVSDEFKEYVVSQLNQPGMGSLSRTGTNIQSINTKLASTQKEAQLPLNCPIKDMPWIACSWCNEYVRGHAVICTSCGHGGHQSHMEKWIEHIESMIASEIVVPETAHIPPLRLNISAKATKRPPKSAQKAAAERQDITLSAALRPEVHVTKRLISVPEGKGPAPGSKLSTTDADAWMVGVLDDEVLREYSEQQVVTASATTVAASLQPLSIDSEVYEAFENGVGSYHDDRQLQDLLAKHPMRDGMDPELRKALFTKTGGWPTCPSGCGCNCIQFLSHCDLSRWGKWSD